MRAGCADWVSYWKALRTIFTSLEPEERFHNKLILKWFIYTALNNTARETLCNLLERGEALVTRCKEWIGFICMLELSDMDGPGMKMAPSTEPSKTHTNLSPSPLRHGKGTFDIIADCPELQRGPIQQTCKQGSVLKGSFQNLSKTAQWKCKPSWQIIMKTVLHQNKVLW